MIDPILICHGLLAALYIGLAFFFKRKQSSFINLLLGYCTSFSMNNQKVWREANRYSTNAMVIVAGTLVLFQVIAYWWIGGLQSFTAAGTFLAIASVLVIPITEIHLRKVFDQNVHPK